MDLAQIIQPGAMVAWGQLAGAPLGLLAALDRSLPAIGTCSAFTGMNIDTGISDAHLRHIHFRSFAGAGVAQRYLKNGSIDIVPVQLGEIPSLMRSGKIPIDVLLVAVSAENADGMVSTGVITDFLPAALERARIVIGERMLGMPWTYGDSVVEARRFTHLVDLGSRVLEIPGRPERPEERRIAERIVELIPPGATLQFGIGGVPDAVLRGLRRHRDIGIHTGILTEPVQALIETGVVTNRYKGIDEGYTVAAYLAGSQSFYDFCHRHPQIRLRAVDYTHNIKTLMHINALIAINSAFEVDLTGQINAEMLAGHYSGQIGGQVDFMKGAAASDGGFSIIGLASANRQTTVSRIVPRLADGIVTSLRSEVDYVVTEYGVAALRGRSIGERIDAMIHISHPAFRDTLRQASRTL